MLRMSSSLESLAPGFQWLIRLRGLALAGQCLLFLAGAFILHIALPLVVILPCLALTAISNILALVLADRISRPVCCAVLLLLDTACLTAMLFFLGGAHNPFTAFYLLHITLAAVLLPAWWTWVGIFICGLCYGLLFLSPYQIESAIGMSCCGNLDFHLQGMLLAMLLVGICIAFFVGHLKSALARRENELEEAKLRSLRNEKFAGLATLAAGVAHELATPLGTIAVISSDLEARDCAPEDRLADARIIRSEVERCRSILEKLGQNTTDNIGENPSSFVIGEAIHRLSEFLSPANFQRLRIDLPDPRAEVFAPLNTLLQALAVLIKNACEADDSNKPVTLRLDVAPLRLAATVCDCGPGMAPDVTARVGEPFFTTKEPGKGMGLGLFLVRMFTERMKGQLRIDSAPYRGSTFTLEFPLPR